jgi:NADH-quinone oxidoreductase subunit L
MQALTNLFPPNDFSLIAVILGLPALGAFVNGVFGKRLGKDGVRAMALAAIGGSFVAALVAFLMLRGAGEEQGEFTWTAWRWLSVSTDNGFGRANIDVKFMLDHLNAVMMLVITGVGFLIHLYATSYMWDDARADGGFHRFFAYLNLFVFAMLVLVLGSSLPILFVGWEGVGLCSYLLIGFWYSDDANASAGKKAFIANRIGDFGLLVAMSLLLAYTGALDWHGIGAGSGGLLERIQIWPIGHGMHLKILGPALEAKLNTPFTPTVATVVGLMLFLGCAGKSAQIPLYVWLPDAMAGPTPVSALIHAATMVTAGVYLVCRLSGVFLLSPIAMAVIAFTGALTAVFAATIGLVQHDIKKVLAYSTVSQLGYMFLGVGVGAFTAGFFHVFTHAFFKACLFLGAGSVIHAMHVQIHDTAASQDMRNMGGLRKWMPLTHATFLVSCLAIAGIPPFSGFFSKDEILFRAFANHIHALGGTAAAPRWEAPMWFGPVLYVMGVAGAVMTAFYMFRAYFLTFWGDFRGWKPNPALAPAGHGHGHDAHGDLDEHGHDSGHDHHDAAAHHAHDPNAEGPEPHESPWQMTYPLVILGTLAAVAGFLNAGIFHAPSLLAMEHWLEPVFKGADEVVKSREGAEHMEAGLAAIGALVGIAGTGIAYFVYMMKNGEPAKQLAQSFPRLYALVYDKWRVDELYDETAIAAVDSLADTSNKFDKWVIDGIIAKLTSAIVAAFGTVLRAVQTGVVHAYAFVMVIGLVGMGWYFVKPHPNPRIREEHNGKIVLEAAPGLGYEYRWHSKDPTKPDFADWTLLRSVEVEAPPAGTSKVVRLEVRNAFDRVATADIEVATPAPAQHAPEIQRVVPR